MESAQLLILGNGFDLHCGLKSRYIDFFKSEILDTYQEHFGNIQMQLGVSGFWEGLLLEYYKLHGDKNYNWCDIENIIKETLLKIVVKEKEKSICIWLNALNHVENYAENPVPIDIILSTFKSPVTKYIYKFCFDFFIKLLNSENKQRTANDKLLVLMNCLLKELNNLESRFCKYLKNNIVNPQNTQQINEDYIINATNLLAEITGFKTFNVSKISDIIKKDYVPEARQINANERRSFLVEKNYLTNDFIFLKNIFVLNFNYTAIFDILRVNNPCIFNNVHGKLCNQECSEDICKSSNVIFGIDDSMIQSQYSNTNLHLFSKTYRKMCSNREPIKILPDANDCVLDIKFYGHSLSEADYSYFQSIFDFYNIYSNNKVNLNFYYSDGYEQSNAIYRLINTYGKTLSNVEQGKNLIHKLLLENRLKIIKI